MVERTLSIVKPEAVRRGLIGEIVRRVEEAGLKVVAAKLVRLTEEAAQGFYEVHRARRERTSSGTLVMRVKSASPRR